MTQRSKALLELWGGIVVTLLFALLLITALAVPEHFALGEKILFFGLLLMGARMAAGGRRKLRDPASAN